MKRIVPITIHKVAITDSRINLTLYKLDAILNGDLDEIIQALNALTKRQKCRRLIQMHKEIWTIGRILQWTEKYFQSKEMDTPRLDGEVLLSHVLGKDRIYLYTHYDQPLIQDELDAFRPLVQQRAKGHCVAAIIGEKDFMGLTFKVNDKVLIPRPDTETLIEHILGTYQKDSNIRILDVCTGPGTILLSLLALFAECVWHGY